MTMELWKIITLILGATGFWKVRQEVADFTVKWLKIIQPT